MTPAGVAFFAAIVRRPFQGLEIIHVPGSQDFILGYHLSAPFGGAATSGPFSFAGTRATQAPPCLTTPPLTQ